MFQIQTDQAKNIDRYHPMMSKQRVLLVGATGETGASILEGLVEDGNFKISIFTQPSSRNKPAVQQLQQRGFPVVVGDLKGPTEDLVPLLKNLDTVISAIGPDAQLLQVPLVDAASAAGVKRFVPCGFTTVCPPGKIMLLRDDKEVVYNRIFQRHLPYTIIDVGFWHQISFPHLPSGRADYATLAPITEIYGDGDAPNLLTEQRDIGRFVARIIQDPRTLNKKVVAYSDELSSNQIFDLAEKVSGEKLERNYISEDELLQTLAKVQSVDTSDPTDPRNRTNLYINQYHHSKYIRADNTLANAKYLGYLDARDLYPDFEPVRFEAFLGDLVDGRVKKVYGDRKL